MHERLSSLDVSFLYFEGRTTPMHVGGLAVFEAKAGAHGAPGSAGLDYERLLALVDERIALVPRYRQKVQFVPGHLAHPVWVDDADFDLAYHVRRARLPTPGSDEQLRDFCARVQSRPLSRRRPLWELYLVEGLTGSRVALITKTHHAMADGISALDVAQVILDPAAVTEPVSRSGNERWQPEAPPDSARLVLDAVDELLQRPHAALDGLRLGLRDLRAAAGKLVSAAAGLAAAARVGLIPAPALPLNAVIGEQRRYAVARTSLADYKLIRKTHATTVNDVVLATVAGALRAWLLFRGEPVNPATTVRALVPVSVRSESDPPLGNRVTALLVDLPVGEPSPVVRLQRVSYAMRVHKESGQSVGADALIALAGFAPPTLHALGARAANGYTRRLFNLVVSNVPGPQSPRYAAGARMLEMSPVVPLAQGQAVSVGVTSYDGGVYYGLNADRDAMPDVDVLATLLEESLAELVSASAARRSAR